MPRAHVNEIDVYYELHGNDLDNCIVLIRGLGTQMSEWPETLIAALRSGGLTVLLFDNRDVGKSEKLKKDYPLKAMADDVVGLLDSLNIPRAHIFGISLGGMITQLIGYHYSDRARTLFPVMTSSGNPNLPPMSPDILARMTKVGETEDEIIRINTENRGVFGSPGYPESQAQRLAASKAAFERCYYPQGVNRQMNAAISDGSRVERIREISTPTLVIHGEDDVLIAYQAGKDVADNIPDAEFQLVPGMGHNIPEALGAELADRVLTFIQAH